MLAVFAAADLAQQKQQSATVKSWQQERETSLENNQLVVCKQFVGIVVVLLCGVKWTKLGSGNHGA